MSEVSGWLRRGQNAHLFLLAWNLIAIGKQEDTSMPELSGSESLERKNNLRSRTGANICVNYLGGAES